MILENSKIEVATALHGEAHHLCFIANSCNFPIDHRAECFVKPLPTG
jgi:organic hydroperoxide reductase OsmC/OhrA